MKVKMRPAEKIYGGILSLAHPDSSVVSLKLMWLDGRQWCDDRVLDVHPGVARKAGGEGLRFLSWISGHERELWYSHGQ